MTTPITRRLRSAALGAFAVVLALGLAPPTASAAATDYGPFPMVIDVRRAEKCLSVDGSAANRSPITAEPCGDDAELTRWQVSVGHRPTSTRQLSVRLRNVATLNCLDADTGTLFPYIRGEQRTFAVQEFRCNGSEQQEWDVDRAVLGTSRFVVDNLTPARGPLYYLQSRPANDDRRGYLSMTQGPGDLELDDGATAYGAPFGIGSTNTLTLSVDSPAIRCIEAGYSGDLVLMSTSPPTFRCRTSTFIS